jgi:hypothetical protein
VLHREHVELKTLLQQVILTNEQVMKILVDQPGAAPRAVLFQYLDLTRRFEMHQFELRLSMMLSEAVNHYLYDKLRDLLGNDEMPPFEQFAGRISAECKDQLKVEMQEHQRKQEALLQQIQERKAETGPDGKPLIVVAGQENAPEELCNHGIPKSMDCFKCIAEGKTPSQLRIEELEAQVASLQSKVSEQSDAREEKADVR